MKSSVILVLIFVLLNWIEISHQAPPPKARRASLAQTAHQAASSRSAKVELFDVLDSDKDGYVTRADLDTFCQGTAYKARKYKADKIYETIGSGANKHHFTWGGHANYPLVDLLKLRPNGYDSVALIEVLGITAEQAQKILEGKTSKTAEDVAEFIRSNKKFAP
ncbi:uncharacterized protein LOC120353153 [Nilaparvata lugens]|uniref:uncharacterized protein LOC120353153 n=1 Tax=Nilaparvata lugens TaxID=108931 RepID=UPI00193CB6BC|nr:uncharacterized protein LOC120353153 [Nilaparvata lugens]